MSLVFWGPSEPHFFTMYVYNDVHVYVPGLSDAQVFNIAFASFVLLACTHRVSVNVALFYGVRVSRTTRISHFPRIAYDISYIAYRGGGGNYAVFLLFH